MEDGFSKAYYYTPIGLVELEATEKGLAGLRFAKNAGQPESSAFHELLQAAIEQLDEWFAGKSRSFSVSLDLEGTAFQQRVWRQLLEIPFGHTITYHELARALGDPKKIRAVGQANGKNPVSLIVPCHRVIGSNGQFTGYAGGLWRKQWLLEFENPSRLGTLF